MRRYDIVSGIFLIFSIVDFAFAVPVSAQEKRQTYVDMVHIPEDVITVLGKRGGEELGNVVREYFKTWEKPIDSSGTHASSSSAAPGPGPSHGSTNAGVARSNPAPSTANPDPLMEPSSPSSTASTPSSFKNRFNAV
jgi:hypothetical protein